MPLSGIPAEQLEHVFSEYHQIKATSNVTGKGVGLGLSIVNKICHLLDYPLQLSSTVNVGTTFSLSLPVGHQTNRALENSTSGETTLAGRKVLIVDDDEDILLGMQLVFSSWGCQTLLASNADDAVKMVFDEPIQPEYLLCDLQLAGGKSGLDVIRAINRDRPNPLPAAIVTGNTSPHRLKEIKAEGVTILHKPVVPDALKSTISSSLLGVT